MKRQLVAWCQLYIKASFYGPKRFIIDISSKYTSVGHIFLALLMVLIL